jgi:DNA-binding transcriptional ArsR family regulator
LLSLNVEASREADEGSDDVCSLTRLIGDPEKAKDKVKKLRSLMKKIEGEDSDSEADIFNAAADPCRIRILKLLREGELCVCEIMTALNRPQSSTSHHLSILKDAGLIKERKDGKWSRYRLSDGAVIEMLNQVKLLMDK